jgi:CheY-like chemotaxis protein
MAGLRRTADTVASVLGGKQELSWTILIVDDSKAARDAIRSRLHGQQGLTVCGEAADGLEAIEKAKELKPDLVLLDLVMPKLNGAAAASVLKAPFRVFASFCSRYMRMLLTAWPRLLLWTSCSPNQVVLSKPDGLSHLIQRVQALFARPPQIGVKGSLPATLTGNPNGT